MSTNHWILCILGHGCNLHELVSLITGLSHKAGSHTSCVDISPLATLLGPEHNYSFVPRSTVYHMLHISARGNTQCCVVAYGNMINRPML